MSLLREWRGMKNCMIRCVCDAYWIISTDYEAEYITPLMTNETGCMMWEQLSQGLSTTELSHYIAKEYDIPYEQAKADVDEFVRMLANKGFEVN